MQVNNASSSCFQIGLTVRSEQLRAYKNLQCRDSSSVEEIVDKVSRFFNLNHPGDKNALSVFFYRNFDKVTFSSNNAIYTIDAKKLTFGVCNESFFQGFNVPSTNQNRNIGYIAENNNEDFFQRGIRSFGSFHRHDRKEIVCYALFGAHSINKITAKDIQGSIQAKIIPPSDISQKKRNRNDS